MQIYSRPSPGIMVFVGESSHNGRKFQVSELLLFAQIHIYIYIYIYISTNHPSIHLFIYLSIYPSIYGPLGVATPIDIFSTGAFAMVTSENNKAFPDAENTHIPCNVVKTIINNPPHHHFHRW